jgi:hypothetical protein
LIFVTIDNRRLLCGEERRRSFGRVGCWRLASIISHQRHPAQSQAKASKRKLTVLIKVASEPRAIGAFERADVCPLPKLKIEYK